MFDDLNKDIDYKISHDYVNKYKEDNWGINEDSIYSTYLFYKKVCDYLINNDEYKIDLSNIKRIDVNNIEYDSMKINLHFLVSLCVKDNNRLFYDQYGFKILKFR